MKKVFISMMTAAMFFASCTSDDATTIPEKNEVADNQESLVAIKLGAGAIASTTVTETRAAVDEWNANQIGVFALDRVNSWDTTIDANDRPVLLNNELGTVGSDQVNDETTEIPVVWTNATNNTLYYPRYSTRTYSFYAYHPYVDDANVTVNNGNSIMVTGTFDGTQDIMVGHAICPTDLGYNAKYFRDIEKTGSEETPDMTFSHLTTRLKIKVAPGHKYNPETCTIETLKMAVPTGYTLRVASTDLAAYPQEIRSWNNETVENTFATNIALEEANIGTGDYQTSDVIADILAKPTKNGGDGYELVLSLPGITEPIIAPVKLDDDAALFEAGKAYTITLTINGPQEIKVTASLTPWEEVNEEIGVEI